MDLLVFLAHFTATLFMTGLIWFVQVVHYPLFAKVGRSEFISYEASHTRRTAWVVGPVMLIEVGTAAVLVFQSPSLALEPAFVISLVALAVIWISTAVLQIPIHRQLERNGDPVVMARLVSTNWIRTTAWSARSLLLGWIVIRFLA